MLDDKQMCSISKQNPWTEDFPKPPQRAVDNIEAVINHKESAVEVALINNIDSDEEFFGFDEEPDPNILNVAAIQYRIPLTVKQALSCNESDNWKTVMDKEFFQLQRIDTWELMDGPTEGKKAYRVCHWVFAIKYNKDGSIEKYKARLVAKEFSR